MLLLQFVSTLLLSQFHPNNSSGHKDHLFLILDFSIHFKQIRLKLIRFPGD